MTIEEVQAEWKKTQEDLEKTQANLKAANAESAGRRKRIDELEALASGHVTALDSIKSERDHAVGELKTHRIRSAVLLAAANLGFEHPEDAFALIDTGAVEITESGEVKGFEDKLTELAKSGRLPVKGTKAVGTPRVVLAPPAQPAVVRSEPVVRI